MQLRAVWYLSMKVAQDVKTQKNGLVWVQYKVGKMQGLRPQRKILWFGLQAAKGMPLRVGALHICLEKQSLPYLWMFKTALEYATSLRVRIHEGSQMECLHTLSTFGIPRYAIPISSTGEMTKSYHQDWINKEQQRLQSLSFSVMASSGSTVAATTESTTAIGDAIDDYINIGVAEDLSGAAWPVENRSISNSSSDVNKFVAPQTVRSSSSVSTDKNLQGGQYPMDDNEVVFIPSQQDILTGRGKRTQLHPGNIRLSMMLDQRNEEYTNAPNRKAKREVVKKVYDQITKMDGGRFLRPSKSNPGSFEVIADEMACQDKIAHDFRTVRSLKNKTMKPNPNINRRGKMATVEPVGNSKKRKT